MARFDAAKSLFKGGQAREQTVLTPEWLLSALGPIEIDPCTTEENPTKARVYYTESSNGLAQSWNTNGLVYVNPPYGQLQVWMEKCATETKTGTDIVALVPFRPQRQWFCDLRSAVVITLAPFPFVGHKQAFPAPLCLLWYTKRAIPTEICMPTKRGSKNVITGTWR